jgi:type I restriction enzyme, S subunit
MNESPKGWLPVPLPLVATIEMGQSPPSTTYNTMGLGLPFFQGKAEFGATYPKAIKFCTEPIKIADGDDVLISVRAPVGPTNLAPGRCCIGRGLAAVRSETSMPPRLLLYWFRSVEPWLAQQGTGSTFTAISRTDLEELVIPLAPFAEQRRIVAILDGLLARVDDCRQRLDKIPRLLARFRQSVLAAACSGGLTEDWRDGNPHTEDPIKAINRVRGFPPRREHPEVPPLTPNLAPDESVPETWHWAEFGAVIGELRNGISEKPEMEPIGTAILRISAVRPGSVALSDVRYLRDTSRFLPAYGLCDGDLLFTRYNGSLELLGVCGMVRRLEGRVILYPDKLMRVRFDHGHVLPSFAEIFFRTASAHDRLMERAKSSAGQNGVSGSDIKAQPFALPPRAEQQEIVRRVDQLFAFADRLEARVQTARKRVDALTQSILAKAFRGELVPTEAELAEAEGRTFESAEELLNRIRTERENTIAPPRKRTPRTRA